MAATDHGVITRIRSVRALLASKSTPDVGLILRTPLRSARAKDSTTSALAGD